MIKIMISTLIAVFVLVASVVVFYWRDSQFDPTVQQMMFYLGGVPIAVTVLLLMPYWLWKGLKWQKAKKNERLEQATKQASNTEGVVQKHQQLEQMQLQLFSASVSSALGSDQALFSSIAQGTAPQLDQTLTNPYGIKLLSYRITDIDIEQSPIQDTGLNALQQRLMQFMALQFEQHVSSFAAIAAHLKDSALFYDRQLAYQYRMHPAWIDPNAIDQGSEESIPKQVERLNALNIHVVLADHWLHLWDEAASNAWIEQYVDQLGIILDQMVVEYHYWGQDNAYAEWIALLKHIQTQTAEVSFLLTLDSEMDQEFLDERMWSKTSYIPSEFMSSCCVAASAVQLQNLSPIKTIHCCWHAPHIISSLKALQMLDLPQYAEEDVFVIIADDMAKAKVNQSILAHFSASPIQPYHYLYSYSIMGNTQQLAKIFSFMVGLHAPDELLSFIYTIDQADTQVVIQPILDNDLTESIDS